MSNLESRLKKLEALNFPSSDVWFMGLGISTLEGMMAYLETFLESTKVAFNAGETEIAFAPPAEYREHFNRWASLTGHAWMKSSWPPMPEQSLWCPILQQARDELATAEPALWQDARSFPEGPVA
jgi:hypothetical protein